MGSLRQRVLVLGTLVVVAGWSLLRASEPQEPPELLAPPAPSSAPELLARPYPMWDENKPFGPVPTVLDDRTMANHIDEWLGAKWSANAVTPAPLADDAEFFRRLSLDLNGRIPTITQLKDFLDDNHPDKHYIWMRVLMGEDVELRREDGSIEKRSGADNAEAYLNHWTTFWRHLMYPQNQRQQFFNQQQQVEPWLRNFVKDNKPYDSVVRELLTNQQAVFFQTQENKPENFASSTSRLFLGIKLECAQCHDDKSGGTWTRTQFWQFAAFFANRNATGGAQIAIPEKKQTVQAQFLDGSTPPWRGGVNSMNILSEWMTSPQNPWFAKAAVNRLWHYLMGIGLVDPVDAASEANPASHPGLHDELARQFVAHQFDIRWLVRSIISSKAYQLTSARTHESQDDPRLFARMNVRGMSPEQLFDSIAEATGNASNAFRTGTGFNQFGQPNSPRYEFIQKFSNPNEKRTETQTSILQALYLMNGKHTEDVLKNSKSLRTVQENAPPMGNTRRNLEELFIVTLSRKPRADELERLSRYVDAGGPTNNRKDALADVFWALINSGEFMLNH